MGKLPDVWVLSPRLTGFVANCCLFNGLRFRAGQHLLSAACDEVAGADTVSWELHPTATETESSDSVCIDLAVPHLSSEQLQVCYGCTAGILIPKGITDSCMCVHHTHFESL